MNPVFAGAHQLAAMIQRGEIGCEELLQLFLQRIDRFNPGLNAVIVDMRDQALAEARRMDEQRRKGSSRGELFGVPMTIKESYNVAGTPTTWGNPAWKNNITHEDAEAVKKLKGIGVNLHGKTNVPLALADFQSYNDVYGTTHNPYDHTRTPGGSSGGSAVALAAGFTGIEAGSDIGGSIRNPAHFCGVFGHKPTWNLCWSRGHSAPGDHRTSPDIAVIGPLGRTAKDLDIALRAMAGPDDITAKGFSLNLPTLGNRKLSDLRVAVWADDEFCPVSREVRSRVEAVGNALRDRGAQVDFTARPALTSADTHETYQRLLQATLASRSHDAQFDGLLKQAAKYSADDHSEAANVFRQQTARFRDWAGANEDRQQLRWRWHEFFQNYDVVLAPVTPTTAFPQDQRKFSERMLRVDNVEIPYFKQVFWAGLSGVVYLPSTVIPTGLNPQGLPIGVQLIGPEYGDLITIGIAAALEQDGFRFEPPPALVA